MDQTTRRERELRIGIDVGGTNTDAVLLDGSTVQGKVKTPTTEDVTTGIVTALRTLLDQTDVGPPGVTAVMIGTTHFTNAVVERRHLSPVAAVRLALPATEILPPTVDWPDELRSAARVQPYLLHGGQEYDGRPISRLEHEELERVVDDLGAKRIGAVALCSVFSPVDESVERQAGAFLRERLPELDITYSHEIGRLGLLERENAAILNASLRDLARRTVDSFRRAIAQLGLTRATVFLTQNDGTLMTAEFAERYPVLTFASGPTNSMRGAGFLSGLEDALVVDIGGTTTDVGALAKGFPREASLAVEVGGVRTNFRMPDVSSIGLGGGSVVRIDSTVQPVVGPDSVGYRLTEQSRVFGGDVLTATDVAAASGVQIGDPARVEDLDPQLVERVRSRIQEMIDEALDRVRLSAEPMPVIVVGGGRILVTEPVKGASRMVVPDHHEVANAIGAAMAEVSGEVDRVANLAEISREEAMQRARTEAIQRAVAAGAEADTVRVVDVEDVPLPYLPGNASRIRIKAVGRLAGAPTERGER